MDAKICYKCRVDKPLSDYNKNKCRKDGCQSWCKECNQKRSRQYYADNQDQHKLYIRTRSKKLRLALRLWIEELKAQEGCKVCGEADPACLDFHHPNKDKVMSVGDALGRKFGKAKILKEIAKCVVLCSNCHRKLHRGRFNLL